MKTMTEKEFHEELKKQGVPRDHVAFKCPMCGTVQSPHDLIQAGAGKDFEEVSGYIGFSCLGRFNGSGPPRKEPDGNPCNWTLGGLFRTHNLEIITEDGKQHPHFELATAAEAKDHMVDI